MEKPYNRSESGAMRESIGTKIDTSLVPYELIVSAAIGLNYGEQKYAARNFESGLTYRQHLASIERHCKALQDGEDIDDPSKLPHYVLLASSVAMLCHNILQSRVIDDRPEPKRGVCVGELAERAQTISTIAASDR